MRWIIYGIALAGSWGHACLADSGAMELARQAARDQLWTLAETTFKTASADATTPTERHEALLGLAKTRLTLKDPVGTRQALEELPRRISPDIRARVELLNADLLLSEGKVSEAGKRLDEIEDLPQEWKGLQTALQAEVAYRTSGLQAALDILRSSPDEPFLQIQIADLLIASDQTEEAIVLLEKLSEETQNPTEQARARVRLARLLVDRNQAAEAIRWLEPILETGAGTLEIELDVYPVMIEALEIQGKPLEAADLIQAFSQRIENRDAVVLLQAREAQNRIQGGELEEMDQQLGAWIAKVGDVPELSNAQAALADAWKQQGDLEKAKAAYERYLSVVTEPEKRVPVQMGLVETLIELGEVENAAVLSGQILAVLPEESPERSVVLFQQADAELRRGNASEAAALFREWLDRYPEHPARTDVLLRSSAAFAEAGKLTDALTVLDEVQREEPGTKQAETALLQRAMVLGPKRVEQALGAFDAYLEAYPQGRYVADAMTEKGIAAYRLGLFDLAIREFVAVGRDYPEHPRVEQAFCLRGWAHYLKGEDREARRIGEAFLVTYPGSRFEPDVRIWLAEMAYNRGEYEEAAQEFQVLVDGDYPIELQTRAAYLAGRSYLSAQSVELALASFERSYKGNSSSAFAPEVLFYMGDALTELDRFDEAIVKFGEVVRDHPESYLSAPALGRIGDCQYTLGERNPDRYVEALNTYRQVKESTDAPLELQLQATYKTGRVLTALGREQDAQNMFLEASATYRTHSSSLPATASLWFVRSVTDAAQFYESREQYRDAIKVYRQLASTSLDGASEAARRIEDLRREHLILF